VVEEKKEVKEQITRISTEADPRSGSMAGSSADFLTGFPLMK
jgi:hypothetical protein